MEGKFIRMTFDKIPTATSQQKGEMVRGGRVVHFKKKNVREAEELLMNMLEDYVPEEPIQGPVSLAISWQFPTKTKKLIGSPRVSRPDLDNMAKLLIDCMVRKGIFKDDSLIYELSLEKFYVGQDEGAIEIYYEEK